MSEEKLRILQMLQEGKINANEGLELLKALDETEPNAAKPTSQLSNRFLRVRINNDAGSTKVNVNIPLSLLKVVTKFANIGMNYIPESARQEMLQKGIDLSQINAEDILKMVEEGLTDGKLVDIDVDDPEHGQVKVEVYVD